MCDYLNENGGCSGCHECDVVEVGDHQFECECGKVLLKTDGVMCDVCYKYVCRKCIAENRKDFNLSMDVELCGVCAESEEESK